MEPRTELVTILWLRSVQLAIPSIEAFGKALERLADQMAANWRKFVDAIPPDLQEQIKRESEMRSQD